MQERCVAATAVLFFYSIPVWCEGVVNVRGELNCVGCDYTAYTVEIQDLNRMQPPEQIQVRHTGEFDAQLRKGIFRLTVSTSRGVVKTELVNIGDHSHLIMVRLPQEPPESKPGTGVISAARLRHKVPKQARKEFNNADKLFESGDVDGSLNHLERATEIDGEYLEAWNNLGCRYLFKNRQMEAVAAFRRALEIDPQAPLVHTNLGIALMSVGKIAEAEAEAREALTIDPGDKKARYVLGLSLFAQRKLTGEMEKMLREAAGEYPKARIALTQALRLTKAPSPTKAPSESAFR